MGREGEFHLTRFLWIAAAVLLTIGGAAVWFAFQRSDFVAGLVAAAAAAAWKAIAPQIAKRMSPEDEARWRDCQRRGGRWDARKKRCVEPR